MINDDDELEAAKDLWQNVSPFNIANDLSENFSKRLMAGMDDLQFLLQNGAKKIYFCSKRFLKRFFKS